MDIEFFVYVANMGFRGIKGDELNNSNLWTASAQIQQLRDLNLAMCQSHLF
jgi:hypothetical protein